MVNRCMLIWLVLLHAFVHPGLSASGELELGDRIAGVVCAPQMACVTEPIQLPSRGGVDLISIPQTSIPAFLANADAELVSVLSIRLIEPEAHTRRLSRLCVWRT